MGAWGAKPFQNDGALDWLTELERLGVKALRDALQLAADADAEDYLDVDDGSAAIAAAELVAASQGHGRERLPKAAAAWLDAHAGVLGGGDVKLARRAVKRVSAAENSELRALSDEHGEESDLYKEVLDLQVRLKE